MFHHRAAGGPVAVTALLITALPTTGRMLLSGLLAVTVGLGAGCVAGRPADAPGQRVSIGYACLREEPCGNTIVDCRAARDESCDSCWQLCVRSGDIGSCNACDSVCDPSVCDSYCTGDTRCLEHGFVVHLPEERDESLYEACRAAQPHERECGGGNYDDDPCDVWARLERPEMVDSYRCLATAACGHMAPCSPPADYELANTVCEHRDARGAMRCSEEGRDLIARAAGWDRDATRDALMGCLDGDVPTFGCVESWAEIAALGVHVPAYRLRPFFGYQRY